MDKPLKSVTHGQCDARHTVTFPAAGHHRPLTATKLYCLVTEAHVLSNNLVRLLLKSGTAVKGKFWESISPLVGRQEGHLACKKTERWGAGVVVCLQRGADLHMAQLMPLPLTVSCFSKIQIGFTFLVLAHPGSPGQRAVKRLCVFPIVNYREYLRRTVDILNLIW